MLPDSACGDDNYIHIAEEYEGEDVGLICHWWAFHQHLVGHCENRQLG